MTESKARKQVFQDFYTEGDYEQVMQQLPTIVKEAEKAAEILEPTIEEKREVKEFIKNFIRKKHRKVYGGTAVDEVLKAMNPEMVYMMIILLQI